MASEFAEGGSGLITIHVLELIPELNSKFLSYQSPPNRKLRKENGEKP